MRLLRALTRPRVHLRLHLHLNLHPHLPVHLHLRVHLLVHPHLRLQHTRLCARGGGRSCNPCTRLVQRCLGAYLSWRRKERHHHLGHTRGSREEAAYWPGMLVDSCDGGAVLDDLGSDSHPGAG